MRKRVAATVLAVAFVAAAFLLGPLLDSSNEFYEIPDLNIRVIDEEVGE